MNPNNFNYTPNLVLKSSTTSITPPTISYTTPDTNNKLLDFEDPGSSTSIKIDIYSKNKDDSRYSKEILDSGYKRIDIGNIIKSLRKSLLSSKKSNIVEEQQRQCSENNSSSELNRFYSENTENGSRLKNTELSILSKNSRSSEENTDTINWTDDMEDEILNLSEVCFNDSKSTNNNANFYIKYGKILQVSLIVLGVSSVYISSSGVPSEIKNNINVIFGASSAILSSVYTLFSFSKKGNKLKEISYDLSNLARIIRCELFKPITKRDNVTNFLIFIQTTRDKLLKKVDID
jgi:hypothetical protein